MPNITIHHIDRSEENGMVLVSFSEAGERLQAVLNTNTGEHTLYAFGKKGDACVKTYPVQDDETLSAVAEMVLAS